MYKREQTYAARLIDFTKTDFNMLFPIIINIISL